MIINRVYCHIQILNDMKRCNKKLLATSSFLFCLYASNVQATGVIGLLLDDYGPLKRFTPKPAQLNYNKSNEKKLLNFKGKLSKHLNRNNNVDYISLGMKTSFGQLFSPTHEGYLGFGLFTGKIDSDNRFRLNSSLGRFIPELDSELFFTHRLLGAPISNNFESLGYAEKYVYENSFSARYTTFIDSFFRKASLNYSYSLLPGHKFKETTDDAMSNDAFYSTQMIGGFSDTHSHELGVDIALGSEDINLDFLTGLKIDLEFDYERIIHTEFYDSEKYINQGLSGLAVLHHQTTIGLLKSSYKINQASKTLYAGYHLGGLELYVKDTNYTSGTNSKFYGISLNFTLNNIKKIFSLGNNPLFSDPASAYTSVQQLHHNNSIASDYFSTMPKLREAGGIHAFSQ